MTLYLQPKSVDEAVQALSENSLFVLAGGTDYYPARVGKPLNDDILDITGITDLRGITENDDHFHIGALTRWTDVIETRLPDYFDGLKLAAREVGGVQIQNAGTIAGNICNASPAADGVPPLLALDAKVELTSASRGTRVLALSEFIQGVRKTALCDDELMTAILIPRPPTQARSAFEKLGNRRYLVISISMVAATITCDSDGRIVDARVAVGACSPVAQRLSHLECDLIGNTVQDIKITEEHFASLSPIDDVRGSAPYRLDVVAEQCVRAIKRAAGHE